MIERNKHYLAVEKSVERSPVTAILGPRQCGKTTLARSFGEPHQAHYFDLESVVDQRRLQNPELMLGSLDRVCCSYCLRTVKGPLFIIFVSLQPDPDSANT